MGFVLIVVLIVIAGWIYLARNRSTAPSTGATGIDDGVPANAYDNPYDTNENNDRQFESDRCDASAADSSADTCDSSDASSSD
jgi:hypothetical protein